jgi:hypothetical protein
VFIDGRTDLYGEFVRTYFQIANGLGRWREALDEYAVDIVMVEAGSGLDRVLRREPGWRLAYRDDLAVIHLREASAP